MLTPERLMQYKSEYWKRGQIDHEDVLYFAYRVLREFPALRDFLSARFPYLFVDEFQDTLPVQAAVVQWLAEAGTVVGVIGDPEQAIYGFLDASPTHFNGFQLDGFKSYTIAGNRRSTRSIVSFLNSVRTDGLRQHHIETDDGVSPTVYFGGLGESLSHARALALSLLEFMVSQHETMIERSTLEVYQALTDCVAASLDGISLAKATRGKFCNQMASSAYADLIHCIKTADETRLTRTIHQAKGGEAEAVFVVLDDGEAEHILIPQAGEEEHRITYVALSRAKSELFIYCPEPSFHDRFAALGLNNHGRKDSYDAYPAGP